MRTGRPKPKLILSEDERSTLEAWARRPKTAQSLALRSKIILACADAEQTNTAISQRLHVTAQTVGKWRSRFLNKGLDGLLDEPRPGTPRKLSDVEVEKVLTMTLESQPRAQVPLQTCEFTPYLITCLRWFKKEIFTVVSSYTP